MLKSNKQIKWFEWLLIAAMTLIMLPAFADGDNKGKGTISGQVTDVNGVPLEGVTVSVAQKGVASVVTNPGGVFTLTDMKQKANILVNFSKDGYALSQATASLISKATKAKETDDDSDDDEGGKKLLKTTVVKTLLKSGAKQSLDAVTGGVFIQDGFKVTFPANSLTVASGAVDLTVTPIDVSTNQIKGAPGDFSARRLNGQRVALESFSMADFTLTQNGAKVNLKPGKTANIELLLPANTPLTLGAVKPLWWFNTANGLWQEEGTGTVGASTTTTGRLAVLATVKHFTFWNSDQPAAGSTAISGKVVDKNGLPIAGASVEGFGVDYAGHSYAVTTDANGAYCILGRVGSTTALTASNSLGGVVFSSNLSVTTGATPTACGSGAELQVANIVLPMALSCISGDVKDAAGLPVAGAKVYSSAGSFATTDVNGAYQIVVPEGYNLNVYVAGYPAVTLTTPVAGATCGVANFRPGAGGGNSCLT